MPLVLNIPDNPPFEDALRNDPIAIQDVQSEKPWHRLAIMMASSGSTVTEIAEKLERTVTWVSLLLRQPWARERLVNEIQRAGRNEIETLLKSAGPSAIQRVIELSESAKNEAVRLAANREIIDRLLGKAVEKIEVTRKPDLDLDKVNQELKALEEQEKALLGSRGREAHSGAVNPQSKKDEDSSNEITTTSA